MDEHERIDGGRLVARALAAHGVRQIFALHGGHLDPILYGCASEGIAILDTRHEQAAALMAEGWSLATGETGVCAVTAGPGFTNALTGIACADLNGSPVVCLAGRRPAAHADAWTLQDLDQLRIVEPMARWARSVGEAKRAGEYTRRAFAEARSGRPGPAYLDVPADTLASEVGPAALDAIAPPVTPGAPAPLPDLVDRVAALVGAAERPIIVAGSGAHWSGAGPALSLLAATAGIPVFTMNAGRGSIPDTDPWCRGGAQPMGGAFMTAASSADLVLCLGVRLGFALLNGSAFGGARLVRVDVNAAELACNAPGSIEVVADVRAFCEELTKHARTAVTPARHEWNERLRSAAHDARAQLDLLEAGPSGAIHPAAAVRALVDVGGPGATYVADGGDSMVWGVARLPANAPGHLLSTSVYFGGLGVGVPYALAAKAARPDEPCLLWVGDGAFGFNAMELDTAVRHDLPIVCVVANNGVWGMSLHGQGLQHGYDNLVATELGDRPYHELARALGGHGERVERLDDLRPAIERALGSGRPAVVDVVIDRDAVSPVTRAMASIGLG